MKTYTNGETKTISKLTSFTNKTYTENELTRELNKIAPRHEWHAHKMGKYVLIHISRCALTFEMTFMTDKKDRLKFVCKEVRNLVELAE